MAMWKNDDEMFALMKEKLYSPVVGDILDQMGYKHQFLPASIRPLAAQVPTAPYILPGETEDKRLRLAGYACTVLENDVYEYQAQKPFGYMTEALDDLKPNEIYIATGAHNSALWGELLTACGKTNAGSGSSGSMSGSSGTSSAQTQTAAWKTGLGVVTEATDQDRAGKIELAAAAVLLDGEGKLESVLLDELEVSVSADSTGHVTLPTDWRTKRQKGDDYPLAEVSSLKKGWAEQVDAFASYLIGMTPEQVSMLKVDKDGKPTDADLLSGCTIAVDRYRDAVTRACANARALGAAKGDRAALGIEAVNGTSDITATDDKDVNAQVDVSIVALTTDADHRVTSAIADMAEPALTVVSDGGVTAPDLVKTKLELGEDYGMRGASALGKEWYEHSEGFCDALKGKTRTEIAGLSGGDADLKALCTIDITDLQKAALDALG